MPVADHVHRGRVIEIDGLAQVAVGVHLGGELALRIDHEGEIYFVCGGELLGIAAQVLGIDLDLVLEDIVAELVAQSF